MDETKNEERPNEGKRRTRQKRGVERKKVLAQLRASGLTQRGFAAQVGINLGTLRGWIYKEREPKKKMTGHFAAVQLSRAKSGAVTLRWPQGIEVEITTELDQAQVVAMVRELLTPCSR
jgi:DNA-binding transcriptional regulator YiaG